MLPGKPENRVSRHILQIFNTNNSINILFKLLRVYICEDKLIPPFIKLPLCTSPGNYVYAFKPYVLGTIT